MQKQRILIVDDDRTIRFGLRDFLESRGYVVEEAESCRDAEAALRAFRPNAAIIDHVLPDGNALDLLPRLKEIDPTVPLLILTGHGSIDLAVRAIKAGAEQFLIKPVELPALAVIVERLLENRQIRQQRIVRKAHGIVDPFLGKSSAIERLKADAHKLLATESTILIQGETGTGKGVLATWLHRNGPRANEAFVDLNCAGLAREFLETELFGHEKGAFTGAVASKAGLFEVAQRGTIFLDEIGDVDPQVQPKLLKVLEEKRFRRLGEVRDRYADVALITATHQDLTQLVHAHRFRSDLYYRISAIPLTMPALRERREDIPALANLLLRSCGADVGRPGMRLSEDAEAALARYSWPGNVRELRNVLERAVLFCEGEILTGRDLCFVDSSSPASDTARLTLRELERRHIERVLKDEQGHVEQAARRLGIPRSSLYQKLKIHGIVVSRF